MSASLFVGWPLDAPDPFGRLSYAQGPQCLREALWNLLLTNPGERLMRPGFGAGLGRWVGEPNTQTTRQLISSTIGKAISRWEPRVSVSNIEVSADPTDPALVNITLSYTATGVVGAAPDRLSLSLKLGGA